MFIRRFALQSGAPKEGYPYGLPAVQALAGIEFSAVTVLVGDNGAGKSTLVEALAVASGFNAEGGSQNLRFETYPTHSPLASALTLTYARRPAWGWFLRAETFYGLASFVHRDDDPAEGVRALFPDLHNRSHGESFLTLIDSRMRGEGLYFVDEPESALSFSGQLQLTAVIYEAVQQGAQFIIATHSPMLMAIPGASVYELDANGATLTPFDDLKVVALWRSFLDSPDRFFRHLLPD